MTTHSGTKKISEEEKEWAFLSLRMVQLRKEKRLSLEEVASRAGITKGQLVRLENGVHCSVLTLLKVCHALGVKLELV